MEGDELLGDLGRRAHRVALSPDRLRAPVAVVRTATGGDEVEREATVGVGPCRPVGVDVDEIACRRSEHVRVPLDRAFGGADDLAVDQECEPVDVDQRPLRVGAEPAGHHLAHRVLGLAEETGVGTGGQVHLGVIGDIGAADRDSAAGGERHPHHRHGCFAHAREAHLRQEVEVVLVQHHHRRPVPLEALGEGRFVLGEHRVEHGHVEPVEAQHGGCVQRVERRVWPHLGVLLGVEPQEVRVSEEDGLIVDGQLSITGGSVSGLNWS